MFKGISTPTHRPPSTANNSSQELSLKGIPRQLYAAPLDVKINVSKYLEYEDIVRFEKIVDLPDRHRLWSHLSQPFKRLLEGKKISQLDRPFSDLCREGFKPDIVKNLDVVTRQRAASCLAPECVATKLYADLYVPWDTFCHAVVACKDVATTIAMLALTLSVENEWFTLIPAVAELEKYLLCIDHYDGDQKKRKAALTTYTTYLRGLHEKWLEGKLKTSHSGILFAMGQGFDKYFYNQSHQK